MLFKRKRDFKPDRTGKGLLNKLYLTPRQRLAILKWTLFGLCMLVLSLVQDVLLSQVRVLGATTELIPCAIFLICIL